MNTGSFESFRDNVDLVLALDYGSRGGNAFFLTLFDKHEEVGCMPWIMYCYSYFISKFGNVDEYDSKTVHEYITTNGYFKYIYNEPNEQLAKEVSKWGGDPYAVKKRDIVRATFDKIVLEKATVKRKTVIAAMYYSYFTSIEKDISKIKYILVSDAISLREESPQTGFSARIYEFTKKDFSNVTLIFLHRDLRAQFASCRHQFINENKGMYSFNEVSFVKRLLEMLAFDFKIDNFAVHYWMDYQLQAYISMGVLSQRGQNVVHAINEKINLNFIPTMKGLVKELGVSFLEEWNTPNYIPSSMGSKWKGTGAYNSNYQKITNGHIQNDSEAQANEAIGPNAISPNRWKKRLPINEKILLTYYFRNQLNQVYKEYDHKSISNLLTCLIVMWLPFSGEFSKFSNLNLKHKASLIALYFSSRVGILFLLLKSIKNTPPKISKL